MRRTYQYEEIIVGDKIFKTPVKIPMDEFDSTLVTAKLIGYNVSFGHNFIKNAFLYKISTKDGQHIVIRFSYHRSEPDVLNNIYLSINIKFMSEKFKQNQNRDILDKLKDKIKYDVDSGYLIQKSDELTTESCIDILQTLKLLL